MSSTKHTQVHTCMYTYTHTSTQHTGNTVWFCFTKHLLGPCPPTQPSKMKLPIWFLTSSSSAPLVRALELLFCSTHFLVPYCPLFCLCMCFTVSKHMPVCRGPRLMSGILSNEPLLFFEAGSLSQTQGLSPWLLPMTRLLQGSPASAFQSWNHPQALPCSPGV